MEKYYYQFLLDLANMIHTYIWIPPVLQIATSLTAHTLIYYILIRKGLGQNFSKGMVK